MTENLRSIHLRLNYINNQKKRTPKISNESVKLGLVVKTINEKYIYIYILGIQWYAKQK